MRALALRTRLREGAFEGEACLLVYDQVSLSGSILGDDVREILDKRPYTQRIFILAPFLPPSEVSNALNAGVPLLRAGAGEVAVIEIIRGDDDRLKVVSTTFSVGDGGAVVSADAKLLPDELREGWLFDLFDSHHALVDAPLGVHFGKVSEKHSTKFLRAANVLSTTSACALLGFFTFAAMNGLAPRRIFVDTAPLLAVAFAIQRFAQVMGYWSYMPPAMSFSSYGGMENLPRLGQSDLVLISASTSGGLVRRLSDKGVASSSVVTFFLLKAAPNVSSLGHVLCDLTHTPGRTFGYPCVENFPAANCTLCNQGYVLAPLEGDQFLLERRGVKRLRISRSSQDESARKVVENLSRRNIFSVILYNQDTSRTNIAIDMPAILTDGGMADDFVRILRRFTPTPLDFVVLVGFSPKWFSSFCVRAGLGVIFCDSVVVTGDAVGSLKPKVGANALVLVDYLHNHAFLRGVNAQMRTKVDGGCVSYISVITVADSVRNLADLRIFLSYGEHGPDTFTYRSASNFMLPWIDDHPSSWSLELQMLRQYVSEDSLPVELQARLNWLSEASQESNDLYLPGLNGPLAIAPDFVFLNTSTEIKKISQADVYTVVSNLIANSRCDNKGLNAPASRDTAALVWKQSVYGQVLICPSNFRDFNDAVLRASILRAASPSELNYSVSDQCSEEMLDILLTDLNAWIDGKGEALPEFLMSMVIGRLRLVPMHMDKFLSVASTSQLPQHLSFLVRHMRTSKTPPHSNQSPPTQIAPDEPAQTNSGSR